MGETRNGTPESQGTGRELEALLEEWRGNLKRAAHRLLNHPVHQRADTSDIVQEGLIQIWQNLDSFHGDSAGERDHLTRKIAKGHALKVQRRHYAQKRSVAKTQNVDGHTVSQIDDPSVEVEKREQIAGVMKALQEIDSLYQEVLYLVFFENLSLAMVSRKLNKTYKVVRGLYQGGVKALRTNLESTGFANFDSNWKQ